MLSLSGLFDLVPNVAGSNTGQISVWTVLIASSITALCTGLGAVPFLFIRNISPRLMGSANAAAAGLMLGASMGLLLEGVQISAGRTLIGAALGIALVAVSRRLLAGRTALSINDLGHSDAIRGLLIVGIMTVHSFAEGIGVGVSFGNGQALGNLITAAIAIHNIPEGLAISLVLIPRGVSVWRAAGWSVFSSLPKPLMAVPAFLFVLHFAPLLAIGLGLAAGAMVWMVYSQLLPEAHAAVETRIIYPIMTVAVVAILAFQHMIG